MHREDVNSCYCLGWYKPSSYFLIGTKLFSAYIKSTVCYASLRNKNIWFSISDSFYDPYEHREIILDKDILISAGISSDIINKYKELFTTDELEVVSLSANEYSNLPLQAYYSNTLQGIVFNMV